GNNRCPGGARSLVVRFDVVDVDHHALRVRTTRAARTAAMATIDSRLLLRVADHHDALTIDELRVHDTAAFTLHLQTHFEAECLAQPSDGGGGIIVKGCRRDARPTGRRCFHVFLPSGRALAA